MNTVVEAAPSVNPDATAEDRIADCERQIAELAERFRRFEKVFSLEALQKTPGRNITIDPMS